MLNKMHVIQDVNEEEIEGIVEKQESEDQTQLKWLTELREKCQTFLKMLPEDLELLERN